MAGLTDRLPTPLSQRLASASLATFNAQGREVDVAVAGIPFRLATTPELMQSIETIPVRREQFDTENDPGEQSLTSWWRRSQSSWHEGAGDLYQENSDRTINSLKFFKSSGVEVFTPGRFQLLKRMVAWTTGAPAVGSRIRTYASNYTRTNLCTNPSAEVDLTGWVADLTGVTGTMTRDTTKAYVGTASVKVTFTSDGSSQNVGASAPALSVADGKRFTISARVWVPTGSTPVRIVSNFGNGAASTLFDQWQTITMTGTKIGTGALQIAIWCSAPPLNGHSFYVDAVIAEETNVVGAYFDGSSPNAAWTGVAHLSSSIETIVATDVSVSMVGDAKLFTSPTVGGTLAQLHAPAGKTIVDGLVSGGNFYDIASDGTLYEGTVASPGTATTWPLGAGPTRLGWGKHRLWVIGGRKLWQPNLGLAGGSAQNPVFTHPNQGWTYTCMAEGSSAMLFGGHDGYASTIQSITFDSGGGLPTLSGAAMTAALPDGELVQELAVLAGQYVGIGTTRGFRVGIIDGNGQITYGPLIVEPEGITACTALTAQGRFFVVAFRTTGGAALAYRVDTGTPLDDGVFPYATDISCDFTGAITGLAAPTNTRLVANTSDGRSWAQSTTEYVSEGWLQTGRVRFRTTEPKTFRALSVEIDPLAGNIQATLIKEGDTNFALGNITKQNETYDSKFVIQDEKMRHAAVKFTLTPTADKTGTPVIRSYQLVAVPGVTPQRMITLPLLCYDSEKANSGQWYGGKSFAADRLLALQLLEDAAEIVMFEDFQSINSGGRFVTIESIRYVQTSPNTSFKGSTRGGGGIIVLQLRTADV